MRRIGSSSEPQHYNICIIWENLPFNSYVRNFKILTLLLIYSYILSVVVWYFQLRWIPVLHFVDFNGNNAEAEVNHDVSSLQPARKNGKWCFQFGQITNAKRFTRINGRRFFFSFVFFFIYYINSISLSFTWNNMEFRKYFFSPVRAPSKLCSLITKCLFLFCFLFCLCFIFHLQSGKQSFFLLRFARDTTRTRIFGVECTQIYTLHFITDIRIAGKQ